MKPVSKIANNALLYLTTVSKYPPKPKQTSLLPRSWGAKGFPGGGGRRTGPYLLYSLSSQISLPAIQSRLCWAFQKHVAVKDWGNKPEVCKTKKVSFLPLKTKQINPQTLYLYRRKEIIFFPFFFFFFFFFKGANNPTTQQQRALSSICLRRKP